MRGRLRARLAALLVVPSLIACGGPAAVSGGPPEVATGSAPSPSPSAPSILPLPPAPEYEPVTGEVYPNAKRLAGNIAQTLTTYSRDETPETVARRLGASGGDLGQLAAAVAPLIEPGADAAGKAIYPQLGGRTPDAVSVMVVTRQRIRDRGGDSRTVTRTLDVRLRLQDGEWAFDRLASAGGDPVTRPEDLSEAAAAVLDDPRIQLPDSAKWDIYRGEVDDQVLRVMAEVADQTPYAVSVLSSGHPFEVFGTDRQSNHTKGAAVDVYAIDGQLVVNQRFEGSDAYDLSRWLHDDGLPQLGSPWNFDGYGGRSFTDIVHADHLHVAVKNGFESNGSA